MPDFEHSLVTYTSVPSTVDDYLDIGSPEVDGPPSPDYVPGLKEPEQAPLSTDYVPGPEELEQAPLSSDCYMPPEDDVFSAEEQPLPIAAIPTTDSPGYIPEFDPNEDPKEDDEEDPEEDPANYPVDSTVIALPAIDHVPSEEVTKPLPQIPSPSLPIPSPPPDSPTHIEIPKSCLPLRKRLCFASPTPSQEVGESSATDAARQNEPAIARDDPYYLVREELYGFCARVDVAPECPMSRELGYGITDTWDELVGASEEIAPTTLQGVNQRVINLSTIVKQETTIIYGMMEEAQDDRSQLRGRVNLLYRDRPVHHNLAVMIEREKLGWLVRLGDYPWMLATMHIQMLCHYVLQLLKADSSKQMEPRRTTRSTADQETVNATTITNAQLQAMINQRVTAALAARDALRSTNDDDSHNSETGVRRTERPTRECTYTYFLKCQPLPFKGTKGVTSLSQWCERMESVFHISNCATENQVKFATCTLHSVALTWWNTHVQTVGHKAAYGMSWKTLMKMMTDKYCPRNEIRKLEMEL
uniref:Reverse transcriptase domain-containing protein n=1 Tax=Tanacetum cinerariifolium TaxID=118510 RepID=A0A6L2MJV1_TANCI|nr:hypothetical protein [Tanacetum cinerariifolium]